MFIHVHRYQQQWYATPKMINHQHCHQLMALNHPYTIGGPRTAPAGALGQCGINSMALPPVLFAGSPLVQSQVVEEVIHGRDLAEESGRIFFDGLPSGYVKTAIENHHL